MKILSVSYPKTPEDEKKLNEFNYSYEEKIRPKLKEESDRVSLNKIDFEISNKRRPNLGIQIKTLLYRNRTSTKRDPMVARVKLGQIAFMGLLVLALFWGNGGNSFKAQFNLAGGLFFICISLTMSNLMGTILTF
jgi:hypothetical protein